MPTLTIPTEEGAPLERELAGPGSRAAAALVDLGLMATAYVLAGIVMALVTSVDPTRVTDVVEGILVGMGVALPVVWHAVFGLLGRPSPGKALLGLEVIDTAGAPAGPVAHLLRSVLLPVELFPLPLPIGLMAMGVEPRARRLGDLVAGTLVLRADDRPEDTVGGRWAQRRTRRRRRARRRLEERTSGDLVAAVDEQLTPARLARLDHADREYLVDLLGRAGLRHKVRDDLCERSAAHFAGRLGFHEVPGDPSQRDADRARTFLDRLELALGGTPRG